MSNVKVLRKGKRVIIEFEEVEEAELYANHLIEGIKIMKVRTEMANVGYN